MTNNNIRLSYFSDPKGGAVTSARLPRLLDAWLLHCDINRHSARTIESRRERVGRLVWFLNQTEYPTCGLAELRAFFHYLNHGHKEPGGRWGNPKMANPLSSGRVKSYHSTLRTFFGWLVTEGETVLSIRETSTLLGARGRWEGDSSCRCFRYILGVYSECIPVSMVRVYLEKLFLHSEYTPVV